MMKMMMMMMMMVTMVNMMMMMMRRTISLFFLCVHLVSFPMLQFGHTWSFGLHAVIHILPNCMRSFAASRAPESLFGTIDLDDLISA